LPADLPLKKRLFVLSNNSELERKVRHRSFLSFDSRLSELYHPPSIHPNSF